MGDSLAQFNAEASAGLNLDLDFNLAGSPSPVGRLQCQPALLAPCAWVAGPLHRQPPVRAPVDASTIRRSGTQSGGTRLDMADPGSRQPLQATGRQSN